MLLAMSLLLAACGQAPASVAPTVGVDRVAHADLGAIKAYLLEQANVLKGHTAILARLSSRYYDLATSSHFDYTALWAAQPADLRDLLDQARATWMLASPGYERIEGIVAGTPTLATFDVILDAGASGADDPENAAPFDLSLPDGRTLARPGNLFGVTESTLWGTFADYRAPAAVDLDDDGQIGFGDALPEANVLKASAEALDSYTGQLLVAAQSWAPSESDAFTALVVMVPTMNEYFDSWKNSRFVRGDSSEQRDFVAISRLADIQDILASLQVVHRGVSPLIQTLDPAQDTQVGQGLGDLKSFVADIHVQEQAGRRYTPEEAELLGAEAQNQATAITGQLTQIAARLAIPIEE
ncbi:MAG: EfeM/EfeO family lipoprotein [Oscillochloris sp.]|nr:EfeM/EfeO family lipoprotein [Oscillochloris sp.]